MVNLPARGLFVLALVPTLLAAPGPGAAQQPADTLPTSVLTVGRMVRLQAEELGRLQGRVGRLADRGVLLTLDNGEARTVPLASIDTLWVRKRHTWLGAAIGGVVGFGAGVFVAEIAKAVCEFDCSNTSSIFGGLLGSLPGAVLGGIIGSAFPRWAREYP